MRKRSPVFVLIVALLCLVPLGIHLYAERYYLRFVPVPESWIDLLSSPRVHATLTLQGAIDLPALDITKDEDLRRALDHIRALSPLEGSQRPLPSDVDVAGWLDHIGSSPLYCTDGTLLVIAFALRQGLPAREWELWASEEYRNGAAHSVAEFFNPRLGQWQAVDGMTSTVIRDRDGSPLAMVEVIHRYREGRANSIVFDQSSGIADHAHRLLSLDTRYLFAVNLKTAVLNLLPPSWFARRAPVDQVIAFAIVTGESSHHPQIYLTKVSFLLLVLCLGAITWSAIRLLHARSS
jgi:hypothetical protein